MEKYKIAGITVEYNSYLEPLKSRSEKYRVSDGEACASFVIKRSEMFDLMKRSDSSVDWGFCEYMLMGLKFYEELVNHSGFMLHASAVVLDGEAYLFSAPCGTGKSTHTSLWIDYFGRDRAYILNDDKPAIICEGGKVLVYGTPFSGKYNINENRCVPLKAICFLERAQENTIKRLDEKKTIAEILNQTVRPSDFEKMQKLLKSIEVILEETPVFKMGCDISEDAVKTSYSAMK